MSRATATDEISDYVEPASLCTMEEWAAAHGFLTDHRTSSMEGLGTVCDPLAEQRGFTPQGFSANNHLCQRYRAECALNGSYSRVTDECFDRYEDLGVRVVDD